MFSASAALSGSVTVLGRGAEAGDFFENVGNWRSLGRPAITSAAARINRCARLLTSARVSFPRFGATSNPTTAPNPSPTKKLFTAASRRSLRGLRYFSVRSQLIDEHWQNASQSCTSDRRRNTRTISQWLEPVPIQEPTMWPKPWDSAWLKRPESSPEFPNICVGVVARSLRDVSLRHSLWHQEYSR